MNGGPPTGGVEPGGAAPPYQGAGSQAKSFRGKGLPPKSGARKMTAYAQERIKPKKQKKASKNKS